MILLSDNTTSQFIEILSSWSNPFLLILFFSIVILLVFFFINRHLIKPLEQKHIQEKKELELKNNRMMALFAELDPDPVIRVDVDGMINFHNNSATKFFNITNPTSVFNYINSISENKLGEIIAKDSQFSFPYEYNGVHFNVLVKGDSSLGIAQIYLRDISQIKNLELKLKQLYNHLQNQL